MPSASAMSSSLAFLIIASLRGASEILGSGREYRGSQGGRVRSTSAVNVNEGICSTRLVSIRFLQLIWTIFSGDDDLGRLAADLSQRVERVHKEPTHST